MKKNLLLLLVVLTCSSASFAGRTWNFRAWSQTTLNLLAADALLETPNWEANNTTDTQQRFQNLVNITAGTAIKANGVDIPDLTGLTFALLPTGTDLTSGKFRIDYGTGWTPCTRLMLNGTIQMNILGCKAGNVITIVTMTGNTTTARGLTLVSTNIARTSGDATSLDSIYNVFSVTADGDVSVATTGGLHVREIKVEGTMAVENTSTTATLVKSRYFQMNGMEAGDTFSSLPKGLYIEKSYFSDGSVQNRKISKAFL